MKSNNENNINQNILLDKENMPKGTKSKEILYMIILLIALITIFNSFGINAFINLVGSLVITLGIAQWRKWV